MCRVFHRSTSVPFALILALLAAGAANASAQGAEGFVLQSGNGDYRLVFGLTAQIDGRFSTDDPSPITNTFTIRKARPTFSGRVAKFFDFKVMPDFGNGASTLADAYVDVRFSPAFRIRTGKDKTPIGYELLLGDGDLLFPERALASSLMPLRDIGVQARGEAAGGRVSYAAGVFNGMPDGTSSTADVDANGAKDMAGRIVVQPFRSIGSEKRALAGLGVHVGGSIGREDGPLPSFKTSIGQTYFAYDSGVRADGRRTRVTPAIFYYYKSLGAFAEYVRSAQTVTRAGAPTGIANHGWDVTGSLVVTGETASERNVKPAHPFDPEAGRWGALQLVLRYSSLTIDPLVISAGLAGAGASPGAHALAVGADWFPAGVIKYYVMFERTTFGTTPSGARAPEHSVTFRTQVAF